MWMTKGPAFVAIALFVFTSEWSGARERTALRTRYRRQQPSSRSSTDCTAVSS